MPFISPCNTLKDSRILLVPFKLSKHFFLVRVTVDPGTLRVRQEYTWMGCQENVHGHQHTHSQQGAIYSHQYTYWHVFESWKETRRKPVFREYEEHEIRIKLWTLELWVGKANRWSGSLQISSKQPVPSLYLCVWPVCIRAVGWSDPHPGDWRSEWTNSLLAVNQGSGWRWWSGRREARAPRSWVRNETNCLFQTQSPSRICLLGTLNPTLFGPRGFNLSPHLHVEAGSSRARSEICTQIKPRRSDRMLPRKQ